MTALSDIAKISAPLPWQADAWSRLDQQIADRQLPHALLLTGPQYTGKSHLALALARRLLCERPAGGLNCGDCHPCELSASGNHGDFRWLEPEAKSRVIKIEQIRQVVAFTGKTAGFGLCKVVVIAPAECMNVNAANALLKVLEEPAANTYLILVCHRLHGLPATVRSRCQLLRLALPNSDQSLAWLDHITGTRAQSVQLLELAGERPLLAAQLHTGTGGDRRQHVRAAMSDVFAGEAGVAALAAALVDDDLQRALAQLVDGIQALLRKLDGSGPTGAQARAGFQLLDEIGEIQRAMNGGANPNQQLLVAALLAKVQRMLGDGSLGDKIRATNGGALT